jgi:signal transduction histidine kinase
MPTLTRTAETWWRTVRAASRRRVISECLFALLLALITGISVAAYGVLSGAPQVIAAAVTALATLVLTPLRLVRPVTALVLGAIISVPAGGISLLIVVLSWSTGYRAKKPAPIVLGYLITALTCWAGVELEPDSDGVGGMLIALALFAFFGVLPGAIAAMLAQRRLLVMTMHQRNLELHQEHLLVTAQAQARERNRIAAELHDSLGHRLTLISLYAGGLAQTALPSQTSSALETPQREEALTLLRDASTQAMGELRQILKVLHQDEPVTGGRSLQEVGATVAAARQTGTEIELVRVGNPRPLGLIGEHAAFRVVQEGLTNALKHAAGAPIRVELRYEGDALFVEVRNNEGRPSWGQSSGQGLLGLAERVRLAGGVLSSGPMDDGFRLGAVLPYDSEVPEPAREPGAGDFPQVIRRSSRRQRIGLVAVVVALLVSLSSCIAAIATVDAPDPIGENVFTATRIGDDENRLDDLLPATPVEITHGPDGERCERYAGDIASQPDGMDSEISFEFCFRNGEVVSKKKIQTKGTS